MVFPLVKVNFRGGDDFGCAAIIFEFSSTNNYLKHVYYHM